MGKGGQNASVYRHGWSNYPCVQVDEVVDNAGHFVCPHCGKHDEYHVVAYIEAPQLTHVAITECLRLTCCQNKLAVLSKD